MRMRCKLWWKILSVSNSNCLDAVGLVFCSMINLDGDLNN